MVNQSKKGLLEVIQFLDPTGKEIVHRVPEEGPGEIALGSQLIVRESQAAIFFRDGKALDVLGPGRHTLTTANIPVLINVMKIPFGSTSPFPAEVYFVALKDFIDQNWASAKSVSFRDADFGMVRLFAQGKFAFYVSQPQLFVNQIVGTQGLFTINDIAAFLANILVTRLTDALGEAHIPLLDLPAHYSDLSGALRAQAADDFKALGLGLKAVYLTSITVPPEVEKAIDERASMGAIGNMDAYLKFKAARAMGDAAKGGGSSFAGAAVELGAGVALGGLMAGMLRDTFQPGARNAQPIEVKDAFASLEHLINTQQNLSTAEKRNAIGALENFRTQLNGLSTTFDELRNARTSMVTQFPWMQEPLTTLLHVLSVQQQLGRIATRSF